MKTKETKDKTLGDALIVKLLEYDYERHKMGDRKRMMKGDKSHSTFTIYPAKA